MSHAFCVHPVPGLPMIQAGDDLADHLISALDRADLKPQTGDVLCLAQKIVSKAEGRLIPLHSVSPSAEARSLAAEVDKDPRLVQLVLDESTEILRKKPGVLIVRHKLGLVGANAGIDQSNVSHQDGECALLLPRDPDHSAALLQERLATHYGCELGVLITDSHNRPWRLGTVGVAIGAAGIAVLEDHRGGHDLFGRELKVTLINRADALATAATLVMGETTEAIPAALIRGFPYQETDERARQIERPLAEDLFR